MLSFDLLLGCFARLTDVLSLLINGSIMSLHLHLHLPTVSANTSQA